MEITQRSQTRHCEYCEAEYRRGELFCDFCGKPLLVKDETKSNCRPSFTDILSATESKSNSLPADKPLRMHLIDEDTTLFIKPKPTSILGRRNLLGSSNVMIDIDLVPFGGFSKGISQVHLMIQRESDSVYVIDQGSKNGTFVNGIQLTPHEPFLIEDGDLVHIGSLPIRFNFS